MSHQSEIIHSLIFITLHNLLNDQNDSIWLKREQPLTLSCTFKYFKTSSNFLFRVLIVHFISGEIKGCEDMHCLDQVHEITVHETVEIMEGKTTFPKQQFEILISFLIQLLLLLFTPCRKSTTCNFRITSVVNSFTIVFYEKKIFSRALDRKFLLNFKKFIDILTILNDSNNFKFFVLLYPVFIINGNVTNNMPHLLTTIIWNLPLITVTTVFEWSFLFIRKTGWKTKT